MHYPNNMSYNDEIHEKMMVCYFMNHGKCVNQLLKKYTVDIHKNQSQFLNEIKVSGRGFTLKDKLELYKILINKYQYVMQTQDITSLINQLNDNSGDYIDENLDILDLPILEFRNAICKKVSY